MSRQPTFACMIVALAACCLLCTAAPGTAAYTASAASLQQVLATWQEGDPQAARAMLTEMIDDGSRDTRVYYYRGVISEQLRESGDDDFRVAAGLEVSTSSTRLVNTALENVQGPLRSRIESFREQARFAITPDPGAARNRALYRDAVIANAAGNRQQALHSLDAAILGETQDPRVFYLRGVILFQSDEKEDARAMFQQGLHLETSAGDVRAVNAALQDVQGEIRRFIEEQVSVGAGDQQITRQSNQRTLIRQERNLVAQLWLANEARSNMGLTSSELAQREREILAGERILADEERARQSDAQLPLVADTSEDRIAAVTPPATRTAPTAPNPFDSLTPLAEAQPEADPLLPAEAPDAPAPTPPANPFLVGNQSAAGSSDRRAAGNPIDFSWLAPNSELVMYARPADLTGSRFMAPMMEMPPVQEALRQLVDQAGFGIADMESVTYGMGDVMAAVMGAALGGGAAGGPDPNQVTQQFLSNRTALSVVRTSRDIDFAAVAEAQEAAELTYGDHIYYLVGEENPAVPQTAVYPVDARTYLFATEAALQAALDRGPGNNSSQQFSFVNSDSHFVLAFSSPALAAMSGSLPLPEGAPPFVTNLVTAVRGHVQGVAIALQTSADLTAQIQLVLNDSTAGTNGLNAVQEAVTMLKQMYPLMRAQVPPELQTVTDSAVQSTRGDFRDPVLAFSLTVPGRLVTILQQSPELLAPFMLLPGMMGGPDDGFGFPPDDEAPGNPDFFFNPNE